MKSVDHLCRIFIFLAVAGSCFVTVGLAAENAVTPAPAVTDVSLRDGGVLMGQLIDSQGVARANVRISLQDPQNQEVAAAMTDQQGSFVISGLRGGVYQVVAPETRTVYRLWAPGMAPPAAQQGALIVLPGDVVRGAQPRSGLKFWLTNPLVVGGVVATAIAVPIAVQRSHHDPASN